MGDNKLKRDGTDVRFLKVLAILVLSTLLFSFFLLGSNRRASAEPTRQQKPFVLNTDRQIVTATVTAPLNDSMTVVNRMKMSYDQAETIRYTTIDPCASTKIYLPLIMRIYPYTPLCNGGFESRDFAGNYDTRDSPCWIPGCTPNEHVECPKVVCDTGVAAEGSCAAQLGATHGCGGSVEPGSSWIRQTFTVSSCLHPELSFKYRVKTYANRLGSGYDRFEVFLNGSRIFGHTKGADPGWGTVNPCSQDPWDSGWQDSELHDLSPYNNGQNVELLFRVVNVDNWYNTWAYVDQVKVECASP